MSIFEIIVVVCLTVVLFAFCLIYSSCISIDIVKFIKFIIQKRKHKKIVKKLKEMPIWDENCIDLLKVKCYGYTSRWDPVKQTFILEKEENDGN